MNGTLSVGRLKLVEQFIAGEVLSKPIFNYTRLVSLDKNDKWDISLYIVGQIFFVKMVFFGEEE